ncbi:glycosyltransferase [Cellulomonas carbonis]|uniref:Glycosyl transferase family 28 n=1 Tax=Cellulomonas carbonis T26 TaxID=947969 RepID=A0A0A0BQQ6_9CELL|nr:glycosyltransferase [Cellulomonas carbonis]KGM10296.1 glycosyl transferase family 28 [Cellulomonas carbonis T26]GGC05448.1 glycosyl transferase [Cellulomonas carbonis]
MPRPGTRRPAFVATTGGHLVQMSLMGPLVEPDRHEDALWITHRTPQSESMLAGRRVHFVPMVDARDWGAVLRRTPSVLAALRRHGVDRVYSTGAAVALTALPLAPLVGARPAFYESMARSTGPSVTGSLLARLPWIPCYTHYPALADGRRWRFERSLLDTFGVDDAPEPEISRIFVTLGTARPWGFRRLVDRVLEIAPPGAQIVWQTGATDVSDLDIDGRDVIPDAQFQEEIERADVVISHSGCGTFIRCMEAGKVPVLVPRRAAHGEHVDDHQEQIAEVTAARGLSIMREADELTLDDLRLAAARRAAVTV